MILRRVIKHFRHQEWTAIFLDFLIVVVGVFVGLQVNNWNAAQNDRKIEARFLEDIALDIRADRQSFEGVLHSARQSVATINYILNEAVGEQAPKTLTVPSLAASFGQGQEISMPNTVLPKNMDRNLLWPRIYLARVYNRNQPTFETITSTGGINLIHNVDLAKSISVYYSDIHNVLEFRNRTIRPLRLQSALKGRDFGLDAYGPNDPQRLFELVRREPSLSAGLKMERTMTVLFITTINNIDARARTLIERIEDIYP